MRKYKKVYIVNFGAELNDEVLEDVKNEVDADEAEQVLLKVNLNLANNPYYQCHELVNKNKHYFLSKNPFVVNLPGLPLACVALINEIAAITSKEPTILFTSRDIAKDGYFSQYKLKRLYNLDYERTVTREKFKNGT